MFRTDISVEMLKVIAVTAGCAVLLWSFGVYGLKVADAANLTSLSDVLSDSVPGAGSDHTFAFVTPSGVGAGKTIVIDFGTTGFDPSALDFNDIDFASSSEITLAGSPSGGVWGVATDATSITLTSGTGIIDANATVTIKVGLNAVFGAIGDTQIVNPATEGSHIVTLSAGVSDIGVLQVALLPSVDVTAAVDTIFSFAVSGMSAGGTVNGEPITGASGSTSIPFGTLTGNVPSTSAQALSVSTNAPNGYVVTIHLDGALEASEGNDIDSFSEGSDTNTPAVWVAPSGSIGAEATYGHWGFTTDDATTTRGAADEF